MGKPVPQKKSRWSLRTLERFWKGTRPQAVKGPPVSLVTGSLSFDTGIFFEF
jgi:hypothetical protein